MRLLEHEIELSISLNSDTYPQAPKYADAGFAACELVFPVSYYEPANMTSYREHLERYIHSCAKADYAWRRIISHLVNTGIYPRRMKRFAAERCRPSPR